MKSEAAGECPACWGGACAVGRGAIWKCSGRRWPDLGLLNRCECSWLSLACFNGFLSGLVSPNCGVGAFSCCRGLGAGTGASFRRGSVAAGSRSRTMAYGALVDWVPGRAFERGCDVWGLSCQCLWLFRTPWSRRTADWRLRCHLRKGCWSRPSAKAQSDLPQTSCRCRLKLRFWPSAGQSWASVATTRNPPGGRGHDVFDGCCSYGGLPSRQAQVPVARRFL
jgi:hypothetical protein